MLNTLSLLVNLSTSNRSVSELAAFHQISIPTVKRQISELRHLGAVIDSVRTGGINSQSVYVLRNWDKISPRVTLWIDLIQKDLRKPL